MNPKPKPERIQKVIEFLIQYPPYDLDQFSIDWLESKISGFYDSQEDDWPQKEELVIRSLHYQVENVLEIMRGDAKGQPFFAAFNAFLTSV